MKRTESEVMFPFDMLEHQTEIMDTRVIQIQRKPISIQANALRNNGQIEYDDLESEKESQHVNEENQLPVININCEGSDSDICQEQFQQFDKVFVKTSKVETIREDSSHPIIYLPEDVISEEKGNDEQNQKVGYLTEPQVKSMKKMSIDTQELAQILLPYAQTMHADAFSPQESGTNTISKPEFQQLLMETDKFKGNNLTINENQVRQGKRAVGSNQINPFPFKSQKKVTFIGDSDNLDEEETRPPKKKQTFQSAKDGSSTTSILHFTEHKRNKTMIGSRKIISQDQNYCLYRLMGGKRSEKVMMCRSVQIRDNLIQQKEIQLYLLSRQHQHQNIVKMHTFQKIAKQNYRNFIQITMDYYPKNLEEYILENKKSEAQMSIQRKIILFQILKGLNFMHSKKIYHRDLNPINIMIGDSLEVAMTNFAYTKPSNKQYSQDNFYECNCYIRPPEIIFQPLRYFSQGGDMWAFGCIAVYMLKGSLPFMNVSDADMVLEMIKLLGVPSKSYLDGINFKDHRKYIFPKTDRKSMRKAFKCEDPELLDMLKGVFQYEPANRVSAETLLYSSYFDELRCESTFKQLLSFYNISSLFAFKEDEISAQCRDKIVPFWYERTS